jgi:hypothetical protein
MKENYTFSIVLDRRKVGIFTENDVAIPADSRPQIRCVTVAA